MATTPEPHSSLAAEAAAWVARLHGPHRTPEVERECLAWQAQSDLHRRAFEHCTVLWEGVRGAAALRAEAAAAAKPVTAPTPAIDRRRSTVLRTRWMTVCASAAVAATFAIALAYLTSGGIDTGVGEQRIVTLTDGSRVTLNTDTELAVNINRSRRMLNLRRGEALFEVTQDLKRPFVVHAGSAEVVAIGTVFAVRLTDGQLSVTLVEGQVAVQSDVTTTATSSVKPVMMRAGERLRFATNDHAAPKLDNPPIEHVTAWRRGEVVFQDLPLTEAVAEMNRYSLQPIAVAEKTLLDRRISGVFPTRDPLAFAHAIAGLYGLDVVERSDRLELSRQAAPSDSGRRP